MVIKVKKTELEEIELDAFLDTVYKAWGYNFNDYARASLKRRIKNLVIQTGVTYISELIPIVLYDNSFINTILKTMSVTVTEMFRDPWVFKCFREVVIPKLKIFPRINIWHAGCATGEEVYTMAIILKEEGLLEQSQIYATDFNNNSLNAAKKGVYSISNFQLYSKNYLQAGGYATLSDYYTVKNDHIVMDESLKKNIIFSNHNLVEDGVFAEVNLIVCRNVMIYFKEVLQNRVFDLFFNSLAPRGVLLLGDKETIQFSTIENQLLTVASREKIYQKK